MAFNETDGQTAPKKVIIAGDTSYFNISSDDINMIRQERVNADIKAQPEKRETTSTWAIISFTASIIPICLWIYCFVISSGSLNEGGNGAVWWLMIIYYWTLGIPLFIASLVFGILGLKSKLCWLSITSIAIKIITIVTIAIILVIGYLIADSRQSETTRNGSFSYPSSQNRESDHTRNLL